MIPIFQDCQQFQQVILAQGVLAPLMYVFLATVLMMVFIPRSFLMLIGGVCFGAWWGTVWVLISSMLAGCFSFLVARTFGRAWVERTFRKRRWFYQLEKITGNSGFYVVLTSRIAHVIHFGAASYAFGLANINLKSYLWGTFWGILPGTVVLLYSSQVLGCSLWLRPENLSLETIYRIVFASLLVFFISCLPWLLKVKKSQRK
ncbi:MAG: TVP38/TMEM64 family protein [Deltaproteobacteria bacterium]|mgnify:FL=1